MIDVNAGHRILIVEDEVFTGLMLKDILEEEGYEILAICATGESAIQQAHVHRPSIILMDIMLSGMMNGIEAANRICARYKVHIIFMTGYSDRDIREEAEVLQPAAFMNKPVQLNLLLDILKGLSENV